MSSSTVNVLVAARLIANLARDQGALRMEQLGRMRCDHLGAVVADSVLQAGLNYSSVVLPRVQAILRDYPALATVSSLMELVAEDGAREFLRWEHVEKIRRFEQVVAFFHRLGVEDADDLRRRMIEADFCREFRSINGVGPKTVDYMSCLLGIESIAVDRHVRAFARSAGIRNAEYGFLKDSFCCAADLMSIPRREFDAWLWREAAMKHHRQLSLSL